jgi:hypothetical protein
MLSQVPGNCGVYSSSCLVHCLSCNADWYSFTVDGMSLAQAVSQWYFQQQPEKQVSSCSGWDCTLACSGGPWMPTNTPCPTTTNVCANTYMLTPAGSPPVSQAQAQQLGEQAYNTQQQAAARAAAAAGGNAAWSAAQAQAKAQEMDPYAKSDVPQQQAQVLGQQAWNAQQEAAAKAAALAAGNAAWSVEQAQTKDAEAQGIYIDPSAQQQQQPQQQQQQQQ